MSTEPDNIDEITTLIEEACAGSPNSKLQKVLSLLRELRKQSGYRKIGELRYFGSDYNKFLNENCFNEMTVMNVDCLQFKREHPSGKKQLRLIEHKHFGEHLPSSQGEVLTHLAKLFQLLNTVQNEFECGVYIVRSDTFEECVVEDCIEAKQVKLQKEDLVKFAEFKESLCKLQPTL